MRKQCEEKRREEQVGKLDVYEQYFQFVGRIRTLLSGREEATTMREYPRTFGRPLAAFKRAIRVDETRAMREIREVAVQSINREGE